MLIIFLKTGVFYVRVFPCDVERISLFHEDDSKSENMFQFALHFKNFRHVVNYHSSYLLINLLCTSIFSEVSYTIIHLTYLFFILLHQSLSFGIEITRFPDVGHANEPDKLTLPGRACSNEIWECIIWVKAGNKVSVQR